ncbi:MAG: RDD family protein [Motilibacteraceae bacterium]
MADVVTGEAVVVDLRVARLASRGLAVALDFALQLVVLLIGAIALAALSPLLDSALAAVLVLLLVVGVLVGYPVVAETLSRGRTLGKLALGLRAVRDDGSPIRFRHALVRGIVGFVELYLLLGVPAVVVSLASSRGKRVGDLLAGTVVVRERLPAQAGPPIAPLPVLAGWAASLDLSALPDDLALAARQFLVRTQQLSPHTRASMGARIAADVAARTSPPPPPGVPAEEFLAAVVAERTRRAYARHLPVAQPPAYGPPGPQPAATPPGASPAPPVTAAAPARPAGSPAAPAPGPGAGSSAPAGPFAPPG